MTIREWLHWVFAPVVGHTIEEHEEHWRIFRALHNLNDRVAKLEQEIQRHGVSLVIVVTTAGDNMSKLLTPVLTFDDGTTAFDATHAQPANWPPVFVLTSGDGSLTINADGTATLVPATGNDVVTATLTGVPQADGSTKDLTAEYDFTAPPVMHFATGLGITVTDV